MEAAIGLDRIIGLILSHIRQFALKLLHMLTGDKIVPVQTLSQQLPARKECSTH